jgi:dolichol-phosphate mannosyltransferase
MKGPSSISKALSLFMHLSVVMPVYNEQHAIEAVIAEWTGVLDAMGVDYELRVYDDGSRDQTSAILQRIAARNPRVIASSHANRGHGPTIMRGYAEARGEWVVQTDSDGEMAAAALEKLWRSRAHYDFLLGSRDGRHSPRHRRILTGGSRLVTAALFGRGVRDVNSPFRLMRGTWLRKQLRRIPADAAVPNIILSGLAGRTGARILELPVPHTGRRTGATSLNLRRIAKLSARAVLDALRVALARNAR